MEKTLVKKELYEIHKPSDIIACKYTIYNPAKKKKSDEYYSLSPLQHDTTNYITYNARRKFMKKYGQDELNKVYETYTDEDFYKFFRGERFELNTDELSYFIDSYKGSANRHNLINNIEALQYVMVHTNYMKKGKMVDAKFPIISRIEKETDEHGKSKVYYYLEPELSLGYVYKYENKSFAKLLLKMQTKLKHTYSKILYELCKDYQNMGEIQKPLEQWIHVLNINPNSSYVKNVSGIKKLYLNKALKEINEITDIKITEIKSRKKDGETFMVISFETQESQFITDFDIVEVEELNDKMLKEKIINSKIDVEAKRRLEIAKENGIIIKSEAAYLDKIKNSISKNEIESQINLDKVISEDFDDLEDFQEYISGLSVWYTSYSNSDLNILLIYKDYKLTDAFTGKVFADTAIEVINLINKFEESQN